jgi:hypothetical protein
LSASADLTRRFNTDFHFGCPNWPRYTPTHEISNGTVNGSKLGFTTAAGLNGQDVIVEWNGEGVVKVTFLRWL